MSNNKLYKNKNNNLSIVDFIKLMHTNKIDQWMRCHKLTISPCPPEELLKSKTVNCTYCTQCINECIGKIKEYKSYYQVGKIKISKEELDDKS